jgi:hypothetical protein
MYVRTCVISCGFFACAFACACVHMQTCIHIRTWLSRIQTGPSRMQLSDAFTVTFLRSIQHLSVKVIDGRLVPHPAYHIVKRRFLLLLSGCRVFQQLRSRHADVRFFGPLLCSDSFLWVLWIVFVQHRVWGRVFKVLAEALHWCVFQGSITFRAGGIRTAHRTCIVCEGSCNMK